jgi:hypothetical protein
MEYTNIIISNEEKIVTFIKNNIKNIDNVKINIFIRKKKF